MQASRPQRTPLSADRGYKRPPRHGPLRTNRLLVETVRDYRQAYRANQSFECWVYCEDSLMASQRGGAPGLVLHERCVAVARDEKETTFKTDLVAGFVIYGRCKQRISPSIVVEGDCQNQLGPAPRAPGACAARDGAGLEVVYQSLLRRLGKGPKVDSCTNADLMRLLLGTLIFLCTHPLTQRCDPPASTASADARNTFHSQTPQAREVRRCTPLGSASSPPAERRIVQRSGGCDWRRGTAGRRVQSQRRLRKIRGRGRSLPWPRTLCLKMHEERPIRRLSIQLILLRRMNCPSAYVAGYSLLRSNALPTCAYNLEPATEGLSPYLLACMRGQPPRACARRARVPKRFPPTRLCGLVNGGVGAVGCCEGELVFALAKLHASKNFVGVRRTVCVESSQTVLPRSLVDTDGR